MKKLIVGITFVAAMAMVAVTAPVNAQDEKPKTECAKKEKKSACCEKKAEKKDSCCTKKAEKKAACCTKKAEKKAE